MSSSTGRRRLRIDIFDQREQEARVLPQLLPRQLIAAILQEFQEVEQLNDAPDDYQLVQAANHTPLDEARSLGEQLGDGEGLILVERDVEPPSGARRPSNAVYLREQSANRVYKLHWLPAIVGRHDPDQPQNERVAVDLAAYKSGLRVSRRHLQISEVRGDYFVQSLSPRNPTLLRSPSGELTPLNEEKQPLHPGDVLVLERSGLALKFLLHSPAGSEALPVSSAEGDHFTVLADAADALPTPA